MNKRYEQKLIYAQLRADAGMENNQALKIPICMLEFMEILSYQT